jgi:hypothetical protein
MSYVASREKGPDARDFDAFLGALLETPPKTWKSYYRGFLARDRWGDKELAKFANTIWGLKIAGLVDLGQYRRGKEEFEYLLSLNRPLTEVDLRLALVAGEDWLPPNHSWAIEPGHKRKRAA